MSNNLVKGLYDNLFGEIMMNVNHHLSYSSSNYSICTLDIAGFGRREITFYCAYLVHDTIICFFFFVSFVEYLTDESNTFDQLCINYINERMQSLFVTRKISDEKHWYDSQGLDIPVVEYFNNSHIIGMQQY